MPPIFSALPRGADVISEDAYRLQLTRNRSGVFGAAWLKSRRKPPDMTLSGLPVYDAPNTDIIVHAPRGVALGYARRHSNEGNCN